MSLILGLLVLLRLLVTLDVDGGLNVRGGTGSAFDNNGIESGAWRGIVVSDALGACSAAIEDTLSTSMISSSIGTVVHGLASTVVSASKDTSVKVST